MSTPAALVSSEDTEIHVPEDAPAPAETEITVTPSAEARATPAAPVKQPVLDPDEGIAKLQRQLEAEREARAASEQRARESEAARVRAQSENQDSQLHMVSTAIASVTQALDVGESQLADAMAAQDYARVAKLQREMSQNTAKLQRLEDNKVALERAPKPEAREAPRSVDPVEDFAQRVLATGSPNSANWIRAHPECVTDSRMNRKMLAAHDMAVADGIKPDSREYLEFIEDTLKLRAPAAESREEPRAQPRRSTPASAPVSRSGNGAGDRPNVVRLSKEEVEIAEMCGMTKEEYARNKYALKKEGKLN